MCLKSLYYPRGERSRLWRGRSHWSTSAFAITYSFRYFVKREWLMTWLLKYASCTRVIRWRRTLQRVDRKSAREKHLVARGQFVSRNSARISHLRICNATYTMWWTHRGPWDAKRHHPGVTETQLRRSGIIEVPNTACGFDDRGRNIGLIALEIRN